ncbi:YheC/YheD family endospore coat-associated protein [Paenibacillus sp. 481]|uniref:YheC/YheD family endospore coat-associated protein n=1 Tax=Paenibacillus sp. 481 TaxID=2835869 RepID=UPI001E3AA9B6|nr:YheC/YheD family protein [Paenibacillus sp. 481]
MIVAGQKIGLDVCLFTAQDVDYHRDKINAIIYLPTSQKWAREWVSLPDIIFDRCRSQQPVQQLQVKRFRYIYEHLVYLNHPLRNKWTLHNVLSENPEFRTCLPDTMLFTRACDINRMIKKSGMIYIKPVNGTGGRGILRIEQKKDHPAFLFVEGRDRNRRIIKPQYVKFNRLGRYMYTWVRRESFIVQQGIHLKMPNGRVHDYRMLVQKNEYGVWTLTGTVGRVGARRSVTSNLHGGGHAVPMRTLLQQWIGHRQPIHRVQYNMENTGIGIAKFLERKYGSLCELALDWAVDKNGRHWLLEVNSKPSREVFHSIGDESTYEKAITQPIHYAKWLYNKIN